MTDTKAIATPVKEVKKELPAYAFPVELQPVFLADGKEISNKKAVVRTDNMHSLGLVSNDYTLVPHANVIDALREAGKDYDVKEKISMAHEGANLFYTMTFGKVQAEVAKGDIIQMAIVAMNSYNGSKAIHLSFGALRLVCLNGMTISAGLLQLSYRHVGEVGGLNGDMVNEYKESFKNYVKLFSDKMPVMTQMTKIELKSTEGLFEPKTLKMPGYLVEQAKAKFEAESGKTVWDYYNSLTYATTHKGKSKNPGANIWLGERAWGAAEAQMVN